MVRYTADFETTTDPKDCRVWAWGLCNIDNLKFEYGNTIESFFERISKESCEIWFHNLRFDGEFLIYYFLTHGINHSQDKYPQQNTFTTLINDMNMFYSIDYKIGNKNIHFKDSLKKLPFSVDKIAKDFQLPISKLKIDYDKYRPYGHILTKKEISYLKNDCEIMARALKICFDNGDKKITAGSDALEAYKKTQNLWKYHFPVLSASVHNDINLAYKGGWTYLKRAGDYGEGIVLDINSLYPYSMYDTLMPYGIPRYFEGEYIKDEEYPLFIQQFKCQFELKNGYLPTIQLKNNLSFNPVQYLKSSNDEIVTLTLTNIDLQIFKDHYNIYNYEPLQGYKFKAKRGMFKEFIDYNMAIKATSQGALRALAKLKQNSLYGKFGTNLDVTGKHPVIENGVISYKLNEQEFREPIYLPIAVFTTAYARNKTIRSAQSVYPRFIYADTDSLHLMGTEIPEGLEIHNSKLGAWKIEGKFKRARFIKPKTYFEQEESTPIKTFYIKSSIPKPHIHKSLVKRNGIENNTIKACGMPDNVKSECNWDNFKIGFKSHNKLKHTHVPGGVVLTKTWFEIK